MTDSTKANFDPVTLEILWSRLISIADESAAALLRTAFSTIVRESNDFATVLMDANGDSLAENTAGILGLGCAAELAQQQLDAQAARCKALRDRFAQQVLDRIEGVRINGEGQDRLPTVTNLEFAALEGEARGLIERLTSSRVV